MKTQKQSESPSAGSDGSAKWERGVTHRGTEAECLAQLNRKTGEVWLLHPDGSRMLKVDPRAAHWFSPNDQALPRGGAQETPK